jgi:glycosyltransferase involved in cell wall biosynthesis
MHVTVIIPMDRPGEDARRALDAVLQQKSEATFDVIVVAGGELDLPRDPRVRLLVVPDRNPAVRRNRAAAVATGDVLGFIDDDAFAAPRWIETAAHQLYLNPDVAAIGGPDPAPADSTFGERIADTLLATPLIGSGIAAHQNRQGIFDVEHPHDVALVNLFVRKRAFEDAGGFDEGIGYIGEDTALVAELMKRGTVVYHSGVVVRHLRRAFPRAYLGQRWRYRVKTGRMLASGAKQYIGNLKIIAFLVACIAVIALAVVAPMLALEVLGIYAVSTILLAAPRGSLRFWEWPVIPFAFAAHHATYFAGIVTGAASVLLRHSGDRRSGGDSRS